MMRLSLMPSGMIKRGANGMDKGFVSQCPQPFRNKRRQPPRLAFGAEGVRLRTDLHIEGQGIVQNPCIEAVRRKPYR